MIPMALGDVASAMDAAYEPTGDGVVVNRVTVDSRDVRPGDLFFAIPGERFDGHQFIEEAAGKGAVACVCRREWLSSAAGEHVRNLLPCLAVTDTVSGLGRLAAHYRRHVMHVATVVVAVTGTNGKTTTKYMIDHVLQWSLKGRASPKSFNNQIGVPLTLLSADASDRYLVVEIGTNSPGEIAALAAIAAPDAGVITSIGEAHLQGLGDIDGVIAEKMSLLAHVQHDGLAVVNIDRREVRRHLGPATCARLFTVGTHPYARLRITNISGDVRRTTFDLEGRFRVELRLPGVHHASNAAAAFAVARWFGLAPQEIIERLRSFEALEGRGRVIETGGLVIVDDAYNANPVSMASAVETLCREPPGHRVFVMGDMRELGPESPIFHRRAVQAVMEAGIETLVAVGPATTEAVRAINAAGYGTRVIPCADAGGAAEVLLGILSPGDRVWVKGSRAVGLDRVVSDLKANFARKAAVA
jgi:UDP-N-acetylmuramoyl-tripeptide--D-alanyl-D-alanine ligase